MNRKAMFVAVLAICLSACRHERLPSGVLPADSMVDVMEDMCNIESWYAIETQFRYDVMTERAYNSYDSLLQAYGIDRERLERSFEYYSMHLEQYKPIQDSVERRLMRREASVAK